MSSSSAKVIGIVFPSNEGFSKTILATLISALEDKIFFAAFFCFLPLGFISLYRASKTNFLASPLYRESADKSPLGSNLF